MTRHWVRALAVVPLMIGLAGCGLVGGGGGEAASGTATAGDGGLPDVCAMFTKQEIVTMTGKEITQIDPDDGKKDGSVRHCQWQLDGGRLAIFLNTTTKAKFEEGKPGSQKVDGLGEQAHQASGHLYVLKGTREIDVYYRGSGEDDAANLEMEKKAATAVLGKLKP